ncbi:hypothetical protein FACS1894153_0480 [Bacteroidia bacterium]|nr:hypothetical protein FACS1894153_0480 [Bacteroidia bacterium]
MDFYKQFCEQLKITEDNNNIELLCYNTALNTRLKESRKIFTEDKNGNVDILVYTLDRKNIIVKHPKADPMKYTIYNNRSFEMSLKRLKEPREYTNPDTGKTSTAKYDFPKGSGSYPFFPPMLCDKYEKGETFNTLVLTEGYKKAWYAALFGVPVVGLSSITHYRDKETKGMYKDVISLIEKCQVKNIIMLYDGDCFDISLKALENGDDLYTRPFGFYNACCAVRELFKDYSVDVYFGCVNSNTVEGHPKGLDDIFEAKNGQEQELVDDLLMLSKPGIYFTKLNITNSTKKMADLFSLGKEEFYRKYSSIIQNRIFVYRGTSYIYDTEKNELVIRVPAEAKLYFRVGNDYFKFVNVPNKYKQSEIQYHRRNIGIIMQDHGKNILRHIPKYEAFCNVPDHITYAQEINNCFNLYQKIEYVPEKDDCSTSLQLIKHIFGEQYELGLDYIQLLYQYPTQVLPILCLVSKENKTGKSTFIKWLKAIFGQNATVIGNDQLNNNFNGSWGSKLIIACEESFVEKVSTVEKIKALSTGDKIQLEMKGRDATEIDFFGKFILASNKEENFIYANKNDIRYWVLKVPKIDKENVMMMNELIEEIPAFLFFLNARKMHTQHESRMWFNEDLLITDALIKLRDANRPRIERVITQKIKDLFLDSGEQILMLPMRYIKDNLLKNPKEDENYIRSVLENNMNVYRYKNKEGKYDSIYANIPNYDFEGEIQISRERCRPYIFEREKFITPEELAQYAT